MRGQRQRPQQRKAQHQHALRAPPRREVAPQAQQGAGAGGAGRAGHAGGLLGGSLLGVVGGRGSWGHAGEGSVVLGLVKCRIPDDHRGRDTYFRCAQ